MKEPILDKQNLLNICKLYKALLSSGIILFVLLISSPVLFAQEDDCYLNPFTPCPEEIPLDGGIVALLVAGAAYGFKRIKDSTGSRTH